MASTWRPCLKWSTPARTLKDTQMTCKQIYKKAKLFNLCCCKYKRQLNETQWKHYTIYIFPVVKSLALPLQGPWCRLLLPDNRGKIVLLEKLAEEKRCTVKNSSDIQIIRLSVLRAFISFFIDFSHNLARNIVLLVVQLRFYSVYSVVNITVAAQDIRKLHFEH